MINDNDIKRSNIDGSLKLFSSANIKLNDEVNE